jgi:hypothetical protein
MLAAHGRTRIITGPAWANVVMANGRHEYLR